MKKLTDEQKTQALAIAGFYDPTWVGDTADLYSLMDALNGLTAESAEQREQGQAVYQYKRGDGSWVDQPKTSHDYNVQHGAREVRVLYTTPHTPPAGVPDGYVLVPVEPTPEMLAALWAYKSDSLQDCYRAMLSAAPQPAAQEPSK